MTPIHLFFYMLAIAGGLACIGFVLLFLFFSFVSVIGWSQRPKSPAKAAPNTIPKSS